MSINITDRSNLLDTEARQLAQRRLLFALSRFDSRIKQIDLVVEDENGPRGGIDKSCRISVSLDHASDVVVSGKDSDVCRCISRAAERAGRAVARTIEKSNDFARLRRTFIDPKAITQT
ncbi:HPF/RaiA family ribosome-associated protein [Rubripirellula reticaptiva]|uniref:Sigma 54 modulation protein / S30EA ribosomal protein n=1 Tax=Rubripirellula reticaptiva TaxID=2528013 RepID=A0A5C6F460_9BACT|nr:HPF/RaiA family ribosome-associated protein [Rubripirellula reticaptiva]TWU55892.1 hypothetical protein Poly59_21950 [Rubripirellula reticaptiva]